MNERIKELRKALNYTQAQFVQYLGITRTALCNIELGERGISEQLILNILKTSWNGQYVNENWLRTGEGEMFVILPEEDEYMGYATELSDDELIQATMKEYFKLSEHDKKVVTDFLRNIVNSMDEHRT